MMTETAITALRAMASLLDQEGYTRHPDYMGEVGYDIHGAAEFAADAAGCFTDELEAIFAGWLLMRGALPGTAGLRADAMISIWETHHEHRAEGVTRELRAAADSLAVLCPVATA